MKHLPEKLKIEWNYNEKDDYVSELSQVRDKINQILDFLQPTEEGRKVMKEIITPTEFIYEVARLEAIASGRSIVPELWSERDEKFRSQMTEYVESLRGKALPTHEEAHDSWWRKYEEMGWVYGAVRDTEKKTHPDMVPFNDLPKDERDKDEIFLALVAFAFKYLPIT